MAKKTVKKIVKKEGVVIYDVPSKEEHAKAQAASEKVARDAAAKSAKDLKAAKAKVEKGLKAGKKAIDATLERVMSDLRHRLSTKEQAAQIASLDDSALAHEIVRLVMSEMTKLKPEDL
jgi:F0F1-type ATP synthase membrane subunit b/b'